MLVQVLEASCVLNDRLEEGIHSCVPTHLQFAYQRFRSMLVDMITKCATSRPSFDLLNNYS